jgi:hypothetical protein
MNRQGMQRAAILVLVTTLIVTPIMTLGPVGNAGPAYAAAPGMNVIVGLFRTIAALERRNRVYREAAVTAEDLQGYYDAQIAQTQKIRSELIKNAATGDTPPRLIRAYTRIEAALQAERAAAIVMIEAEKNAARREFNRTLGRELTRVLIASPGGQEIIRRVRETLQGVKEAATAVQAAVESGRPLEALRNELAKQVGDIPIAQALARELGSVVGRGLDQALGGLLSNVERAIDNVQNEMGKAIDLTNRLDAAVSEFDQKERRPISLVGDGDIDGKVIPVGPVNPALDVAADAYAGAAALSGALAPGTSRSDMRGRIRGALLDERLEGIRDAISGNQAGKVFCTGVGQGEYENAAHQLGLNPQKPSDPEKARYVACYDIPTQVPVYARMYGASAEKQGDATPTPEGGVGNGQMATYTGVTELPSILLDAANLEIEDNEVTLIVNEDGTVSGEKKLNFRYTGTGVDGAIVYLYEVWSGPFEGSLTDGQGEITWVLTNRFVSSGPGANDPQDRTATVEVVFEVNVSDGVLSASLRDEEVEPERDIFSFQVTKQ